MWIGRVSAALEAGRKFTDLESVLAGLLSWYFWPELAPGVD